MRIKNHKPPALSAQKIVDQLPPNPCTGKKYTPQHVNLIIAGKRQNLFLINEIQKIIDQWWIDFDQKSILNDFQKGAEC